MATRSRQRIIRIANHKGFQNIERPRDREGGGGDHHQNKQCKFTSAELIGSGRPRHLLAFRTQTGVPNWGSVIDLQKSEPNREEERNDDA
jgi:hypothetical protein